MGVKNAMPADREVFDFYVKTVHRLFGSDAHWCAAGIGANQIVLNEWAIAAGGHARTGLEDNVRLVARLDRQDAGARFRTRRCRPPPPRGPGGDLRQDSSLRRTAPGGQIDFRLGQQAREMLGLEILHWARWRLRLCPTGRSGDHGPACANLTAGGASPSRDLDQSPR
jgi:hypothetical protein